MTDRLTPEQISDAERLMKRCQIGVGGRNALDDAHDIMAECYGTFGLLIAAARREALLVKYKQFALAVLEESRLELADLDGGWLQDTAEECGLLERVEAQEPCGEQCRCDDFPADCLRYTSGVRADIEKELKP